MKDHFCLIYIRCNELESGLEKIRAIFAELQLEINFSLVSKDLLGNFFPIDQSQIQVELTPDLEFRENHYLQVEGSQEDRDEAIEIIKQNLDFSWKV